MSLSEAIRGYADRSRRFGTAGVNSRLLDSWADDVAVLERELERHRGGPVEDLLAIEERIEPPGKGMA